jgi:NodT family efflux transporter outer membrane factor (OMF) lipoprotein
LAEPGDARARGPWWSLFGDATLDALEGRADAANQTLAQAEAQYRQARAAVAGSRAQLYPTVSGTASATRERISGSRGAQVGAAGRPGSVTIDYYALQADLSWELDLWGRVRRLTEASMANAQASAGDLAAARLSVQAQLAQDYLQLRALDRDHELLDAAVKDFEHILTITRNRYDTGVDARADVLAAQAQLESARAQAIDVGVQRAQLEHAVAVLVGEPPSRFTLAPRPLAGTPPQLPAAVPSQLLERRPDVAAAERRVQAANAQIGVAKAAYFPQLTLTGSGGVESTSLAHWFSVPALFWSLGPQLAGLIFDGGARRSQLEQARAAYEAQVAAYRQTVLSAIGEVEDNLAALRLLAQEAEAAERAVVYARKTVTITSNEYAAGTVGYLELLNAQTVAINDERIAADLLGRRMVAAALLVKGLGGGWNLADLPRVK